MALQGFPVDELNFDFRGNNRVSTYSVLAGAGFFNLNQGRQFVNVGRPIRPYSGPRCFGPSPPLALTEPYT